MILTKGEKVYVIHRRLFEKDISRHFAGIVESYEGGVARISGHVFVVDHTTHKFIRREGQRTRIVPLQSGELLVNVLPFHVDLSKLRHEMGRGFLRVTDGSSWRLDISEFT